MILTLGDSWEPADDISEEAVHCLRMLIEKSKEWSWHLCILDGDVAQAYDFVRHRDVATALVLKGVPKIIVAAFIRSVRGMKSTFKLASG